MAERTVFQSIPKRIIVSLAAQHSVWDAERGETLVEDVGRDDREWSSRGHSFADMRDRIQQAATAHCLTNRIGGIAADSVHIVVRQGALA